MDSEHTSIFSAVNQFYARQTQSIDEGNIGVYSGTFASRAIIVNAANGSRLTGHNVIHATALENFLKRREARLQSRHFMLTQSTRNLGDGMIGVLSHVLILQTPHNGLASILASVICDDIITKLPGDEFTIQFRTISPFG